MSTSKIFRKLKKLLSAVESERGKSSKELERVEALLIATQVRIEHGIQEGEALARLHDSISGIVYGNKEAK